MPDDPRVAAFEQLCRDQAVLWRLGEWQWIGDAVDPLQRWAKTNGLVRLIGQDAVQRIMADAFTPRSAESLSRDREYDPSGRRHGLREPPGGTDGSM